MADPDEADVVVIGAGHNALVCAAYLAASGLEVVVLEAREVPGGNTVTEQLTLPGFQHDSCSSAHVLIQANPLLRDDELGLLARYGLHYVRTDPAVVMPLPDGDALVMHRDLEATVGELARWSAPDAAAFRALVGEWEGGLAAAHGRWNSGLPVGDVPAGTAYEALRRRSALDVVTERFEHPVVRSFLLWLAFATIQPPDRPGTGALPAAIAAGRLRHGWATPVGGSGALPAALLAHLADHGGRCHTGATATQILVRHGRAAAVRTADGRELRARRAVVSSAHLADLPALLDGVALPDDLRAAQESWRPGLSLFAVHAALRADLRWHTRAGSRVAVAGALGTAAGLRDQLAAFHAGHTDRGEGWLLVVSSTVVDPQRAPDGAATLKLLTVAPYERADGQDWDRAKTAFAERLLARVADRADGLGPGDVLAVRAESPVDLARANRHNRGGSCHGGEFRTPDGGTVPGWPAHRGGVPGLYLTGATTHPGGSVSGRPGRNTARVLLGDLGLDPARVMGPG